MLQRWSRGLRGWVEAEVSSSAAEEFFNRCAGENLPIWAIQRDNDGVWRCRIGFFRWKRAEELAQRTHCELTPLRRGGLVGRCWLLRRRWGFWVGMALAAALVAVGSNMILRIEVSGNVTVPTGKILTQLKAQGVRVGAFGPGLDVLDAAQGVILEIPELSWMTINRKGTVAEVVVREGKPRPELLEEDVPARVVAKYPGIVTRVRPTSGEAKVQKGDTVAAGDVLIDSWVDFVEPEYFEGDLGGMTVRATGQVWARTWHTLQGAMTLEQTEKTYTGGENRQVSLEFLGKEVKFYGKGGIPYRKYDKIITYHRLTLPFGVEFPLAVKVITAREYCLTDGELLREEAVETLKAQLLRQLSTLASEDEVQRTDFQVKEEKGLLTVTLLAECVQQIGMTVEDAASESEGKTR